MKRAELEERLGRLRSELEDLEETLQFNFTHSAAHISGGQVRQDEESISELKSEIARIEKLLTAG